MSETGSIPGSEQPPMPPQNGGDLVPYEAYPPIPLGPATPAEEPGTALETSRDHNFPIPTFAEVAKDKALDDPLDVDSPPDRKERHDEYTEAWRERPDGTWYLDAPRVKSSRTGKATWNTGNTLKETPVQRNPRTGEVITASVIDVGDWDPQVDTVVEDSEAKRVVTKVTRTSKPLKIYSFAVEVVGSEGFDQDNREWFKLSNGTIVPEDELSFPIPESPKKATERIGSDGLTARQRFKKKDSRLRSEASGRPATDDPSSPYPGISLDIIPEVSDVDEKVFTPAGKTLTTTYEDPILPGTNIRLMTSENPRQIVANGPDGMTQSERLQEARLTYDGNIYGKPIKLLESERREHLRRQQNGEQVIELRHITTSESKHTEFSQRLDELTKQAKAAKEAGDRIKYNELLFEMADLTDANTEKTGRPLSTKYMEQIDSRLSGSETEDRAFSELIRDLTEAARDAKVAGNKRRYTDILFEMADIVANQSNITRRPIGEKFLDEIDNRLGNEIIPNNTEELSDSASEKPKRVRRRTIEVSRKAHTGVRRMHERAKRTYRRIEDFDRRNREIEGS